MKYLRMAGFFAATLALYLGVPLIGWGVDRVGEFFSNRARLAYALVVVAFALAVGVQAIDSPEGIRGGRGEEGKLVRRQSAVRIAILLLFYAMLILLPFSDQHELGVWADSTPVRWAGVVLCGVAYALIFLSGLALGKQYSQEVTIQPGHRLIVTGIYRRIRNPRYLGVILGGIGLSCLFRSWIGLFVSAGVISILLLRIRDEEALMHKEFGQEWEEYCRRSWRLVPYVY